MKKKNLIVLLLIAVIGIVGVTIAYFSSTITFENEFQTKEYGTTYTESFVSPDNWLPGDTTNKTITATNTGQVDQAVRISLSQTWVSHNGDTLALSKNGVTAAVLNLANTSDWTKVGDYYYYNYKLAPGETTTSFLESVTFNKNIELDDTCTESVNNGVRTISCNSSGDDYDNATYTLTLTIETVQYNKYIEAWGTNVVIAEEKPQPEPTGVEYLATEATNPANAEYNESTKGKMFQFTHTLNEGTENETIVNDSRYIGEAPNNYVYFNCDDPVENQEYNYATSCEVWRILGVFDVDDGEGNVEQRMKLVRGTILKNMQFDSNRKNDWTATPLNTYLNDDYYNGTVTNGLKETARDMIGTAKYYLGAVSYIDSTLGYGSTEKIYGEERGNIICGACNNNSEKLSWKGNVGLMYPSDMYMVYKNLDETCYTNPYSCSSSSEKKNGWIYKTNILTSSTTLTVWFLTPRDGYSDNFLYGYSGGNLGSTISSLSQNVRPVVYLKSSIKIKSGTGEETNPYVLGL